MVTHNNSKPAAELRIGTVKATVWENEVGGITHHNVTFSRIYPEGGAVEDHAERKAEAAPTVGDNEAS